MTVQEAKRSDCTPDEVSEAGYAPSPVPKPVIAFFAVCRKIFGRAEDTRETIRNPPIVNERGTWNLEVIVEPDPVDGGFVAEAADIPGAMSQGETVEEALENLGDAIQGILVAKMEEHLEVASGDTHRFSVHI